MTTTLLNFTNSKKKILLILFLIIIHAVGCSTLKTESPEKKDTVTNIEYPKKPVQIIVAFGPGGANDILARLMAKYAEEHLGQPLAVINKAGGGGTVGFTEIAQSKGDGYTVGLVPVQSSIFGILLNEKVGYKLEDFKPIIMQAKDVNVLTVKTDSPWRTIDEFIKYAKDNPGKIQVGTGGKTSLTYLCVATMAKRAGIELQIIPFEGAAEQKAALLGGHIDAMMPGLSEMLDIEKDGRARALVVADDERSPILPNIPTLKESGVDMISVSTRGYVAPKDTPDEVIQIIHDAFQKAMNDSNYKKSISDMGLSSWYLGSDDYQKHIDQQKKDVPTWLE